MEEDKINISHSKRIRLDSWIQFFLISAIAAAFAVMTSFFHFRLDLTGDHRYTLSAPTKKILSHLRNDVYIQVYLDGEMEIPFKKFKRTVRDMLDEFRIISGKKLDYAFINPFESKDAAARDNQYNALCSKGLIPIKIRAKDNEGGTSQKIIFPGMLVNYNGIEVPVNFLSNNTYLSPEQNLLHSAEGLEYQMIQTISTLCSDTIYKVAFLEGQGEIPEIGVADITFSLAKYFTIDRGSIGGRQGTLDRYSAVVVAGPEKSFTEKDKFVLDQYIMNGGKVMWLCEEVKVDEDSLVSGETVALYRPLSIEDQLFKYGVRINPEVVQDMDCMQIPVRVETTPSQQQVVPMRWIYYPLLSPSSKSPVTRNLNKIEGKFVNYIDTVGSNPDIRKTVLLSTSARSRTVRPPLLISLKEVDDPPAPGQFNKSFLPVAVLLEGKFQSAFKNRMLNDLAVDKNIKIRMESLPAKMIIIADGDIIRNGVTRSASGPVPSPLGQDVVTQGMFGNRDFLVNCLNYLVDDNGIMELRSRELKLRLLNKQYILQNRILIQLVNTLLPAILVILAGIVYNLIRKKRFANN